MAFRIMRWLTIHLANLPGGRCFLVYYNASADYTIAPVLTVRAMQWDDYLATSYTPAILA